MRFVSAAALAAILASVAMPAEAGFVGVPTGQHATVMNNVARARQQNNAAIAHVGNSIAATRRKQF